MPSHVDGVDNSPTNLTITLWPLILTLWTFDLDLQPWHWPFWPWPLTHDLDLRPLFPKPGWQPELLHFWHWWPWLLTLVKMMHPNVCAKFLDLQNAKRQTDKQTHRQTDATKNITSSDNTGGKYYPLVYNLLLHLFYLWISVQFFL